MIRMRLVFLNLLVLPEKVGLKIKQTCGTTTNRIIIDVKMIDNMKSAQKIWNLTV